MKITIISDKDSSTALGDNLFNSINSIITTNKHICTTHELHLTDFNPCIGCFGCWVKTPGVCVFDDAGRQTCSDIAKSDVVLMVTPIRYGCYSPVIRRVLDRNLPNILPFFKKINNEVHHAPRYDKYPQLIVIGYGENISEYEAETFKALTDANAVNFQIKEAITYVCRDSNDVNCSIASISNYIKILEGDRI